MKGVIMKSGKLVSCVLVVMISITASCAANNQIANVKKGELRITLRREGTFVPADPVELKFWPEAYEGTARIEEIVKNGKPVKKGDVLLRLDKEPIEDLIRTKELDLKAAKLQLEDARVAFTMLDLQMKLALTTAENQSNWSKKNLDQYIRVEVPLGEDEHQHKRQTTVDYIQDQKEEIEQLGKMYSEDELTEETEEIVLRRAKRRLQRSITGLELQDRRRKYTVEIQRPQKLDEMNLDVRSKEQSLEKLRTTQRNQKDLKEIELRKTEISVENQTREFAKLRRDLKRFVITAPSDGIVYHGQADAETPKTFKVKDTCTPYTTFLTVAKPGEVKAKCMIDEKDIFRLKPNMPVKVKPVALPDVEFSGLLEPLDLLPGKNNQWEAIVKLQDTAVRLIPRMKCKVEISLQTLKNALLVPNTAVFEKQGKRICYVKKGDEHEVRQVQVGKSDAENTEIKKGLKVGEQILLKEPVKPKEQKEP